MTNYACLSRQVFEHCGYVVRPVQPNDIEDIRIWRNAQMDVLRQSKPIAASEQEAYYAQHIWTTMSQAQPRNLLVGYVQQQRLIGYGGLVHIEWEHRRAEISFLLDPARTRQPAEYEADLLAFLHLMKEVAFDVLGFNRLFTETYATRAQHIAALEAANFRLEGVLREHVVIGGKPVDSLFHGCLRAYER